METFVLSNIGKRRKRNEDSYLLDEGQKLFMVCDGMGGHKGGDVAAQLAVDTVANYFRELYRPISSAKLARHMTEAVWMANHRILHQSRQNHELMNMGTTLTAVCIGDDNFMTVAHVGDSSLYLYRSHVLRMVTKKHTLAEKMVEDKELERDDTEFNAYKHVLIRALGIDSKLKVDVIQKMLLPGDILLLCSDGLTDLVADQAIQVVLAGSAGLSVKGEQLVNEALQLGGHDNITVLLIEIK